MDNLEYYREKVKKLIEGGVPEQYPELHIACKLFWETHDYKLLKSILDENPGLIADAERAINETQQALEDCPLRPFPKSDELESIQGQFNLGYVNPNLDFCGFDPLDFTRGLFVCGAIGSGKSYPILRLLSQILSVPITERGFNVLVIQVVKRDADFLVKRFPDFRIIEWENLRRNIFEVEPWDKSEAKINSAVSIFSSANYLRSLTQPILNECVDLCRKDKLPLNFTEIFDQVKNATKTLEQQGYDTKNMADKVKLRINEFAKKPQLNLNNGLRIDNFWSEEDICLNLIEEKNTYIYSTVITDILISLQRYYERFPVYPPKLRTLLIIDECRTIFPNVNDFRDFNADRFLELFVTTRRAAGIGLIALTQEPQSVSTWLTNNSAFFLTFPIRGEAVEYVQRYQNLSEDQVGYIPQLPKYGTGIMSDVRFNRPFLMQVPGDFQIEIFTKEEADELTQDYIKELHERITKNKKEEQSAEVIEYGKKLKIYSDGYRILEALKKNPFLHKTAIRDQLGLADRINKAVDWLTGSKYVIEAEFRHSSKGKAYAKYLVLTEKGQDTIQMPRSRRISKNRFQHTLFIKRLADWIEGQGYEPIREYHVSDLEERIDVFAIQDGLRTACEITLSTKTEDVLRNVHKCFNIYNVDELYIICDSKKEAGDVQKRILPKIPANWIPKIIFT
ncbi:hypothetical protein ACFL0O_08855, partial [Thermodesulfobacteriota bacterium]